MPNCYYYDEQRNHCNCYVNENLNELLAENAKLVDVLHEVETEAVYAYRCLQQDCITIADSVTYFFEKWWHTECELDRVKAENAKLRELVSGLEHCCQGFDCDCCPLYDPSGTNHRRCESLERELGIEVDE